MGRAGFERVPTAEGPLDTSSSRSLYLALFALLVCTACGATLAKLSMGTTWLESVYFSVATLTTVGCAPTVDPETASG